MTAPNKNEGLIARLEKRDLVDNGHGGGKTVLRNPDGPEAARAIQDLEEEAGRKHVALFAAEAELTRLIDVYAKQAGMKPAERKMAVDSDDVIIKVRRALASTADGGALRPSASVPAGAVIQGEDNRQEREE